MPIKDLSESVRFPRLGKIHLGTRHPEKGYPMKSDHFVFPKDHSDYEKLVKVFGEETKELRILIPTEDEEQWATQYYKAYNQTYGLVCKGDGEAAMRMVDTKTKKLPSKETKTVTLREISCLGKECPAYKAKKCHEVMNLKFIIPEIPGLGVWQIDTGSINSILNINSCAKIIKRSFGRISLIPLKLTFEPTQVNNPEDGKKQTVYVMNLRTDVTMAQLADAAREQTKTFMLEGPDLEAVFDAEIEKTKDELWGEVDKPQPVEPEEKIEPQEEREVAGPDGGEGAEQTLTPVVAQEPTTIQELMSWVMAHGKKYTPSWVCAQLNVKAPTEITNPNNAYIELKAITGWEK